MGLIKLLRLGPVPVIPSGQGSPVTPLVKEEGQQTVLPSQGGTQCSVPTSSALDKNNLEGDRICLHLVLLQMSWPWPCTLPVENGT